jgi:hypothetical protein
VVIAAQAGQQAGDLRAELGQRRDGRPARAGQRIEGGSLHKRDERPGVPVGFGGPGRGEQPGRLDAEAAAQVVVGGPQLLPPGGLEGELEPRQHPLTRPGVGNHPVEHPRQNLGQPSPR